MKKKLKRQEKKLQLEMQARLKKEEAAFKSKLKEKEAEFALKEAEYSHKLKDTAVKESEFVATIREKDSDLKVCFHVFVLLYLDTSSYTIFNLLFLCRM